MNEDDEDLALQTLLATWAEVAPYIDQDLLRKCYAIQKRHQFNDDRTQSLMAMDRLIDEAVTAQIDGQAS
jgi:hypothetical protein